MFLVNSQNLDVREYTLLFDGPLTWRISRDRMIALHVVLLDSILLLLQKQDDSRLVLRCFSTLITAGKEETKTTHSPIIRLSNLIIRSVATGEIGQTVTPTVSWLLGHLFYCCLPC